MLTETASTNLLQKHLKVLLTQWHKASNLDVKGAVELAFVLMLNRALGQLLEEEKSYISADVEPKFTDISAFLMSDSPTSSLTPLQSELSQAWRDPSHWVYAWFKSWQSLCHTPGSSEPDAPFMIAKQSHGQHRVDLENWFAQFNELVVNVRTQNEYC